MAQLLVVVPWIGPKRLLRECIDSMQIEETNASLLVVNNSGENLGIAGSWNKGLRVGCNWTLLLSAAMYFPTGLEEIQNQIISHGPSDYGVRIDDHSFHAFAMHRRLVDFVGEFDEGFYPMEYEETDYRHRMKLVGIDWYDLPTIKTDAICVGSTIAGQEGFVPKSDSPRLHYLSKWGGDPGEEKFSSPFNKGRA